MKKAKYVFVTILLGALGSAFWEMCLKKLFLLTVNTLMPFLLQYFNDSFYTRVARSLNATSFYYFAFTMTILVGVVCFSPQKFRMLFHYEPLSKYDKILRNSLRCVTLFLIAYNYFAITIASITARDTVNNIEIVAPYINDIEYKQLRSAFFQMDSKSDYQNLIYKLESIAEEYSLQLK